MNHMRTLKKVLALSLVFAMAFTMMAGAAFKDQDKIDSSLNNDIQLLTALGVFKGDENGNFNPTANVKRSEAAKMIYVLKNNGVDDGAVAFQGVSKYADVPVGHWAEGYINYCTNLGYMGGWKEGNVQKFDPNGNVTGVELTKMLLCMIGYKADIQGYTGNGWQTNVLVDAATSGLSANFIPSIYGATPRQWTARLMTNAIDAEWVAYSKGELTYQGKSYGVQFLKLDTVEGTLVATNHNKINMAATAAGKISDALNDTDTVIVKDAAGKEVVVIGEADAALLGQPVKMYYKLGTNMKEAKLYAVMPYSKTLKVINTTVDAVKFDGAKVTVEGLGTKTYDAETADVFANGVMLANDSAVKDAKTNGYLGVNSTEPVTLVADQNGVIKTILLQSTVAYAQVDKIDAAKNTLTFKNMSNSVGVGAANLMAADGTTKLFFNNGENNKANFNKYLNVASDVKDGSVVKITANLSSGKLVYDVTLANKINASVSAYTLDKSNNYATLTVNGETLKPAVSKNALEGYGWTSANSTLTNDKTFYTDGKYVIFSEGGEATASVSNLAYLIKAGDTGGSWNKKNMVKVVLADGTIAEYEYKDDTDYLTFATDINKNDAFDKAYLYAMDGGKIKLKALPTSLDSATQITWSKVDAADVLEFNKSNGRVTVKDKATGATVKADLTTDATSFFFVRTGTTDNYKYSVVKASEMAGNMKTEGTAGDNITYAAKTINGFPTMLYGVIHSENAAVSDKTYAIGNGKITSAGKDGDKYIVTMEANVNGKNETLKWSVSSTNDRDTLMKTTLPGLTGKIFTYTVDANGYVGNTEKVTIVSDGSAVAADKWHKVVMSAWDGKNAYVTVSGGAGDKSATLSIASDVKIHYVDTNSDYNVGGTAITNASEAKGVEDGNVVEGNKLLAAATQGNAVIYVKNVNNNLTITEIFVETEGMDIGDLQQA